MDSFRDYHEATKHTVERLRRSAHFLDWANMPDPFRHYEGVPVVDLPAAAPPPRAGALHVLRGGLGERSARSGPELLSALLFHSAAISASKVVPSTGYRYSLRVNPSSGNLHPTEFHFAARGLDGWDDGLYHYRPSSHMAELRARGDWVSRLPIRGEDSLVFVLTSIAWREAWKYQQRAYRYCLLDIGHAWQSLALAAAALGYESEAQAGFDDGALGRTIGVDDEWPMLMVAIRGCTDAAPRSSATEWIGGVANSLSLERVAYPLIDAVHAATAPAAGEFVPRQPDWGEAAPGEGDFARVVRQRRSALDFIGGDRAISPDQFQCLLDCAAGVAQYVQLYAYVHRVEGLEPGVYRNGERIRAGDQRVAAAGLSLQQQLAGNACVAFSMIADIDRAARDHGPRAYRYVHFEAGAIGHRLYVASEAMGFRSTGIGAFFDDQVHRYLGLEGGGRQVVYHFACGYPVHDARLNAS